MCVYIYFDERDTVNYVIAASRYVHRMRCALPVPFLLPIVLRNIVYTMKSK
jgi:hypothetical protein